MRATSWLLALGVAACTPDAVPTDDSDTDSDVHTDDTDTDNTAPQPGTQLVEVGIAAGLSHVHWQIREPYQPPCRGLETHAASAAVGDYDGDGYDDIFFTVLEGRSLLYKNRGDGTFAEVSASAGIQITGWPAGSAWGDVDGDGDLDLLVSFTNLDWMRLYLNQGDGTFLDKTSEWGLGIPAAGADRCPANWSLALADPDVDGDLDLMLASWGEPFANDSPITHKTYFENDRGRFWDVTKARGFDAGRTIYTFTPSWGDLDGDGRLDMAMTSDFLTNQLYLNQGDGTWAERGAGAGITDVENGMGSVLVDFDEDGDLDWLVTAIFEPRLEPEHRDRWGVSGNRIYLNDGTAAFTDHSEAFGLRDGGWAWGIAAFDIDNDADLDVGWTNGHFMGEAGNYLIEPFLVDPTTLYVRDDADTFVDRAFELGLDHAGQGRGYVPFDYDNDGDLDILIVDWGDRPRLYRNDLDDVGHWLVVRARRTTGNRHGIGATVWVKRTPEDPPRRREINANPTYLSQGPIEAHVGLGEHDGPLHEVRIVWPEGHETVLTGVAPDQVLVVSDGR